MQSLSKLSRIDSAIRESMRLNTFSGRGLMREVAHPNGITLPDGQKVPHGAWLGISISGISRDERYYSDPDKYDPFRFSRARTEIALMKSDKKNGNTDETAATTATATTTTTTAKATDKVISNEKNGVNDDDYSPEPVHGNVNGTATNCNKLDGSWLSTPTEEFFTFGFGKHSWYVFNPPLGAVFYAY